MTSKVEISHKTIIFTVLFLIFLWLVLQATDIILLVFVSFIFMSAFKPWAEFMEKYHVPRPVSILLIYITLIGFLAFAGSSIIPPVITQTIHLGENLPKLMNSVLPFVKIDFNLVTQQIAPFGENLVKVTFGIFGNIVTLFSMIVMSFYMLMERKRLDIHLSHFMGEKGASTLVEILIKIEERLGAWIRGQLTLALSIGIVTFIGLMILGIPYSLSLAIFAGLLEIVPTIGPIISAIPAILVAWTISPIHAVSTILLYFALQQLEGHIVVPLVMNRAVGLPPLVTIIAILVGAKLGGISGALLAVPIFVTVETIFSEYLKLREGK